MAKFLWAMLLMVGWVQAQVAAPGTSSATSASSATPPATSPVTSSVGHDEGGPQQAVAFGDDPSPVGRPGSKVGLVRGVVKRLDPIHDQLWIRPFGGGTLRIGFNGQTQFFRENTRTRLTGIPAGSVVSVDTVINDGKLFARTVRTGASQGIELSGQVVRYDAAKSRLTLHDPLSAGGVSLRITPSTRVVNRGQPASPQALSPGMLVQVRFSPAQKAVTRVEILAEPGNSFTFEGRIVAVDLRLRVVALSNDSDKSVRELSINSLDNASLQLLREGANVSIQAEFDGDRYNVRTIKLASGRP
jgi:hypothetical protein